MSERCDPTLHPAKRSISQDAGTTEYFSSFYRLNCLHLADLDRTIVDAHGECGPLPPVHRRLTRRAALEATMLPKVLFRDSTNSAFYQAVDTHSIL